MNSKHCDFYYHENPEFYPKVLHRLSGFQGSFFKSLKLNWNFNKFLSFKTFDKSTKSPSIRVVFFFFFVWNSPIHGPLNTLSVVQYTKKHNINTIKPHIEI